MVVHRMQRIERMWTMVVKPAVGLLKELNKDLQPYTAHPANPQVTLPLPVPCLGPANAWVCAQIYASGIARIAKVSAPLATLVTEASPAVLLLSFGGIFSSLFSWPCRARRLGISSCCAA